MYDSNRPDLDAKVEGCWFVPGGGCPFCDPSRDGFFARHGHGPELPFPGIPTGFRVLQDLFPINDAHVFLVPRQHDVALAQCDPNTLARAVTATYETLRYLFPERWLLGFEHGTGLINHEVVQSGGCHVDHAHGHLIALEPASTSLDEVLELTESMLERLGWEVHRQRTVGSGLFAGLQRAAGSPYLHIGGWRSGEVRACTYTQSAACQSVPSQLMRRVISECAGRPHAANWNWKLALESNDLGALSRFHDHAASLRARFSAHFGFST